MLLTFSLWKLNNAMHANFLHALCTAGSIVASDGVLVQTVSRQRSMLVCICRHGCRNVFGHGSPQGIVVELGEFEQWQIVQGLRDFSMKLVSVKPETSQCGELSHRGWDGSSECRVRQRQRSKSCQSTNIIRDGSSEPRALQPQRDCMKWKETEQMLAKICSR